MRDPFESCLDGENDDYIEENGVDHNYHKSIQQLTNFLRDDLVLEANKDALDLDSFWKPKSFKLFLEDVQMET